MTLGELRRVVISAWQLYYNKSSQNGCLIYRNHLLWQFCMHVVSVYFKHATLTLTSVVEVHRHLFHSKNICPLLFLIPRFFQGSIQILKLLVIHNFIVERHLKVVINKYYCLRRFWYWTLVSDTSFWYKGLANLHLMPVLRVQQCYLS